jgi:hypothetical protein
MKGHLTQPLRIVYSRKYSILSADFETDLLIRSFKNPWPVIADIMIRANAKTFQEDLRLLSLLGDARDPIHRRLVMGKILNFYLEEASKLRNFLGFRPSVRKIMDVVEECWHLGLAKKSLPEAAPSDTFLFTQPNPSFSEDIFVGVKAPKVRIHAN